MSATGPAVFAGIANENEFFSHHYLSELFEGDIKDTVKRWNEAEASDPERTAPHKRLWALRKTHTRLLRRAQRASDPATRLAHQREWHGKLLAALGFGFRPTNHRLEDGDEIPVLSVAGNPRSNGGHATAGATERSPELLAFAAFAPDPDAAEDPLTGSPSPLQFHGEAPPPGDLLKENWEQIITRRVFGQNRPPRWLLLLSFSQLVLIERRKWAHSRLLRFDFEEILGRAQRAEDATIKATTALLHRSSLIPGEGAQPLLDGLDDNSHRHAFAVSTDLKYAMRESIELIGNEAIRYLREVSHDRVYNLDDQLADKLGLECVRYMYRLLFLFYIEARPELGYAPLNSDAYRAGYSLERLRDLELVELATEESRSGFHFHESIETLFRLIREGFDGHQWGGSPDLFASSSMLRHGFRIRALDSALFRKGSAPLLDRVKLRNHVLQRVIELMSLSRPVKGRGPRRRGRISYSQLGVNQLGAVYESLLSYRGFFAETDLYEVKKAKDKQDDLAEAWFVRAEELDRYALEERVYDTDENGRKQLRRHAKGSFIYRLRGRDREKSASYYTPESLTKCLIRHSLRELISDSTSADAILDLTVCEPAMGSAAFLNEAVNQLAELYLDRKQKERDERIPHDDYPDELQRAKRFIADRNVYGVDLNPVAVELAEVSLWLNAIHRDGHVPWFGYQLACGNSLVGARREVYASARLRGKRRADLWFNEAPKRVAPGPDGPELKRPQGTIYHFLLPDPGMAGYRNNLAKKLEGTNLLLLKEWRRTFFRAFKPDDIRELERLSDAVDRLWTLHTRQLARDHRETEDPLPVWGRPDPERAGSSNEWKDRIRRQGIFAEGTASPYHRLKLVMDYWCALWFWPVTRANDLPSRDEFLNEISLVLTGDVRPPGQEPDQSDLFGKEYAEHAGDMAAEILNEVGMLELRQLFKLFPRLKLVDGLANRHRFHHWELVFADVFYGCCAEGSVRGGFDLVVGNPPWVKVRWDEKSVLGEFDPLVAVKTIRPRDASRRVEAAVTMDLGVRRAWFAEMEGTAATQAFLNATQNYPLLSGQQTNLFKCFLPQAWRVAAGRGVVGLLHPEGPYEDPRAGIFRAAMYPRLRGHFQFLNERKLFSEIHNQTRFSINIYGRGRGSRGDSRYANNVAFAHISNLFSPVTVDACLEHAGHGSVPNVKDNRGQWNLAGHSDRMIQVTHRELEMFASLYDVPGTRPLEARLPALHSRQLVAVLKRLAIQETALGDFNHEAKFSVGWDESGAQRDGTIRRRTAFPGILDEAILSGPHYFCGNPFYKTPRTHCKSNKDYDTVDLVEMPDDYLPRTNYVRGCDREIYESRTARAGWIEDGETQPRQLTECSRVVSRDMVGSASERTLTTALLPKGVHHLNTSRSIAFRDSGLCCDFSALTLSVVLDFFIKTTGTGHVTPSYLQRLPLLSPGCDPYIRSALRLRNLILNCLTSAYADSWEELFSTEFRADCWAKLDSRLPVSFFARLTSSWTRDVSLRTQYARRQALVEIDVLAAMGFGLTLDDLCTLYRVQFRVLNQYERDTWYDREGRIVFTVSKGLVGVGLPRRKGKCDTSYAIRTDGRDESGIALGWEDIRDLKHGVVTRTIIDDTLPGGPVERTIEYHAPFDRCDREEDYRTAWAVFEERLGRAPRRSEVTNSEEHP